MDEGDKVRAADDDRGQKAELVMTVGCWQIDWTAVAEVIQTKPEWQENWITEGSGEELRE